MNICRCMKCMNLLKPEEDVCPVCGHAVGTSASESYALKPGTILDGKYLVGEMLGQGGFGITYIGFDLLLEQKVAIKEYYPMSTGMVSRENRSTVLWSSAMLAKTGVEKGFDSFLKEARKMAKLGGIPGVVGVKSVFIQNETAYIVMDFIQGQTLQKKLEKEGPMDYGTCLTLLTPIMEALAQVHKHGIIHRDISPDNIMVQPDGSLVLLDLGAAKDLEIQKSDGTTQSSQLVAKHGFSPLEQYTRSGQIGSWTDVYAMAATVYYCCTGKLPPASVDRVGKDELACRPNLTSPQFAAIAAGMAIFGTDRPQTMGALLSSLEKAKTTAPNPPPPPPPKLPKWLIPGVASLAAAGLLIGLFSGKQTEKKATPSSSGSVVTEKIYTMPNAEFPTAKQTISWLGGVYTGDVVDSVPEGSGILTWDSGAYTGEFQGGYPAGTGTYTDNNEEWVFSSDDWSYCENSRRYLYYPCGKLEGCSYGSYTGMLLEDQACGYGYADIDYCGSYEGSFSYGYPQGTGTYHRKDGTDISGFFLWSRSEGLCLNWNTGDESITRTGMCLLDPETNIYHRFGWAILEFEKGGTFCGEFQNDIVDGAGVYVSATISDTGAYDELYGDNWKLIEYDQSEAGYTYFGLALDGQWQGYGLGVKDDGSYYLGEVSAYLRDGYGRRYSSNGTLLEEGLYEDGFLVK